MKVIHFSLWTLIFLNFLMACILLCAPHSFSRAIEDYMTSFLPKEASILEKSQSTPIPDIKLNGSVDGEVEIVKRKD